MLDTTVYLEKLTLFGRLLREQGFEISPKENADACSILLTIDIDDRDEVKTALKTVYAKSRDEQLKFDKVFDSFFLSEDAIRALDKKHQEQELAKREAVQKAEEALKQQTPNAEYTEEEKEAYSQLSEEEKKRLEEFQKRFAEKGSDRSAPLYADFIHSVFMKSILEQQIKMEDAALGVQAIDPEIGLMFKGIADFKDTEIPKAVMYINDLAAKINGELTKKNKNAGGNAVLDFKKTIRKGLETGGSFYHLKYKRPKKRKKQLLLVCDVSGSMIQFSEFALRLIQALNQSTDNSRVFLFSEESVEADPFHLQNMDQFRDYVKESNLYGRGTNLGEVLKKINDERPSALSSSTMLVIVSDVKSMDMQLTLNELDRARSRAGKVYCLNPIPESRWKYSSSILSVKEKLAMLPCSTLAELGLACRRLTSI